MKRIVNFPSFSGFFLFEKFGNQNKTKKQRKMAKRVYHLFLFVLEKNIIQHLNYWLFQKETTFYILPL